MKLSGKDIELLKGISQIAGIFTLIVALTMIFSFVQLKTIDPLDNPALVSLKDQYDNDQENADKAEQVRAMDLMARKAYFASRRQVETGSYLLLAGAVIFIICQQLISGNEKVIPSVPGSKQDQNERRKNKREYLLISVSALTIIAIVLSFLLRNDLPDLISGPGKLSNKADKPEKTEKAVLADSFRPGEVNYPFFRGEDGRGIAGGSGYLTDWNGEDGTNIKWKIPVPGNGKSSPVIWGDKIFITGAEDKSAEVYCIDKNTGELIWRASASGIPGEPSELPEMNPDAGLAVSTVAVNEGSVCAIFANGNLICLDHDGNQKWSENIGTPENIYGYSSSLIIFNDILIVPFDSNEKISLMGFDIESGELNWETIRRGRPAWSSPVIGNFNGESQVIINGNPEVTAFDPSTGKELWAVDCMSGDVAPSVAVNSSTVYAVTDYAKLVAIKPGQNASIIWEDNMFTPDVSSPVANEEFVFVPTGYGEVACYNATSGDTVWTHYLIEPLYASPIIADEKVYFLDRSGTMHIISTTEEFNLVAKSSLGENVDCTPAFSEGKIYIRGKNNLYCISAN
ncbi:MAG: PQQ-binding-like beta-propeller repeat protein [Bacteroidales bacterium]|nr:PQQ-binding-like beta-propeller repeat protein [Bacteroidales bacterium]